MVRFPEALGIPLQRGEYERISARRLWKRMGSARRYFARNRAFDDWLIVERCKGLGRQMEKRRLGEKAWLERYLQHINPVFAEEARQRLRELKLGRKSWVRPPFTGPEPWMLW